MIECAFDDDPVGLCFVSDDGYACQTAVMIRSIIDHADPDRKYDINILYSSMDDTNRSNLISLSDDEKISIRCHDISSMVSDSRFYTDSRYTNTTYRQEVYYRLLIPSLMPGYDKVLYLDGDMVALTDIRPLLDMDISGHLIAATRDYCGIAAVFDPDSDRRAYRESILGDHDPEGYVISCLILFNIREFNREHTCDEIMKLSQSRQWQQHDQDVINVLCKDRIMIIDPRWAYFEERDYTSRFLPSGLREEYENAFDDPYIIHFAADRKPWMNKCSRFNRSFWDTASRTPFFDIFNGRIGNDPLYRYHVFRDVLNADMGYYYTYDSVVLVSEPQLIGSMRDLGMHLEKIWMTGDTLHISGYFENIDYNSNGPTLIAEIDDSEKILPTSDGASDRVYGGRIRTFDLSHELKDDTCISFRMTHDGVHSIRPSYVCVDQFAPINENEMSYCFFGGWCIRKMEGGRVLHIDRSVRRNKLERGLMADLRKLRKRNVLRYRLFSHTVRTLIPGRSVIFFIDSREALDDLPTVRELYPGKKMVVASRNGIPGTIDVMSFRYKLEYTRSDTIIATAYDYYAFFPFTSFTRSDEIRDLLIGKRHILLTDGVREPGLIGDRNYKVDGLIIKGTGDGSHDGVTFMDGLFYNQG